MILKDQKEKKVYSDGNETEQRMLQIAKKYPEDESQDYIANNSEYTVNNTFSSVRQNILNWYPFKKDADILEVGAGMGSITGMLCDRAKNVTAIEMSEARADVIHARYPERNNLEIISEDITIWETDKKFDYIVFIGVLEYAAVFSPKKHPFERFLQGAKNLLKDDGIILFAIENRFGLKYWLGGSEDHLQQPFVGIEGYKKPRTPKTFSKSELEKLLDDVGLNKHRFYSVYPDYKFPELICTQDFKPSYMNLQKVSFTYSKNSVLTANEKELYKDIIDNNVWEFFANSYLVEAAVNTISEPHVIHVSARGECKKQYRTNTIIYSDKRVVKKAMHPKAQAHIDAIWNNNQNLKKHGVDVLELQLENGDLVSRFSEYQSAQDYFVKQLSLNNRKEVFRVIELLKEEILKSSEVEKRENILTDLDGYDSEVDYGIVLKNGYIDMTLYNAFYHDDKLVFYDQEWCFSNVPLNFILYYGIKSSYYRSEVETEISFDEIVRYAGIDGNYNIFDKLEDYIWAKVLYRQTDFYGEGGYCNRYDENMSYYVQKDRVEKKIEEQKNLIEEKENLIEEKENKINEQVHKIEQQRLQLDNKNEIIQQRNITINNQRGHIEQLLEVDRHYQNIVRSKGWRLVSFPGRVFEKLYPVGTPRRRRISNVVKYVKAVNITNIKFVANAFRKGGMKQVRKEMNAFKYRCNNELPSVEPQIWEVDEITDLSQCDKLVFRKWDAPKVSIVIPVYNQFTYTYNCLKSILENSGDVSYEIIIADDVSNDLTTRLSEVAENIQIARNKENQRFLRNCNQAAKYAKGEYILFLNNDTQVQENWLQPLVELMERDDSIGMVGSKLIYPDGSLQEAGGIIWGDGHAWNYGNGQNANKPEFNYVKEVDYVSGAAIMIRTSLWREIGGFDELFAPAYCEDSDLAFEVRKHGYKLMYQPASVVVHFEGKSNGTDLNAGVKSYQVENSKKLAEKWKEEFARQSQTEDDLFHARERSQNKKTILVIDHYVPQFDKDAGSKTTWQYLKMFVKQGYNVKFMGDNFFQDEEYTPVLEQYGIEVLYGPWYAENYKQWIIDNQDNIDFVYLNRPHITEKYIDFIKNETNIKCIYYGHDLHFLRIFREYELCKDEALLQESEDWKRREFAIMKQADINYYPSYVEVDEIHKVDSSIPAKAITAYVYEEFRDDISLDFAQKNGILFVGGFGHPPNEDAVLWFAKNVYPLITKKQDIPFYIVGSNATDAVKRLNSKNIIVKGFVTEEELKELYDTCKLVVVPLRYGAGVKGKVVEALYYGTPMVTTTVGIEGIKGAEEFMEVADEPEEFAQKVLTLYNDNDRLVKTVEDYQKYIKAHNSIDAVWDIVKEDFQ